MIEGVGVGFVISAGFPPVLSAKARIEIDTTTRKIGMKMATFEIL